MAFSKKDKILIKNLQQFRTKNWTRTQILTILKRTLIQTYNSAK